MENQKISKSEIDIEMKDMLWELARRWRIIVVMACICAIGLAMYQYRIDRNKTDVVAVTKTQEELEKAMSAQDVSEVTGAVALLNQLKQKSEYMDASVLMKINPYAENAVLLQYIIVTENSNQEALVDAYQSYIEDGYLAQIIAETDEEKLYTNELISILKEDANLYAYSDTMTESIQMMVTGMTTDRYISIKVSGLDESSCTALANEVKSALIQYASTLNSELGTHQLKLVEEKTCVLVDNTLAELQNRNATAIKTISNNIDKMKNEMTSDQVTLYTYRVTGMSQSANNGSAATNQAKAATVSVKHLVMGLILGVILGCGIILALYLFAEKLRNSEEIKTLYHVKVLGEVENPQKKKRIFSFVDKFVANIKNYNKKVLSYNQALQMVCANIVIDCKKNEQKAVYLTGSMIEQIPDQIVNDIIKLCKEKDVIVEKGNAVAYDAEALEALEQIGKVVFLEKKHSSLYDEIYKEIALCKENDIHVMGFVVVGE